MANIEEVVNQAIADFDSMKDSMQEIGIEVPAGTDTSQYGNLVKSFVNGLKSEISDLESEISGLKSEIADIETALDGIIAIQNTLLGVSE